jgi:hypothetical protein
VVPHTWIREVSLDQRTRPSGSFPEKSPRSWG